VLYTYDIKWERSELRWSNRWDVYLKGNPDDEIHYFSIVNSLMIVLFLTGVVAMIMLRTLHKDISSYNEMQTLEEAQEESGWKLVHGDVFRPPAFSPMLLSVLAGEEDYSTIISHRILHRVSDMSSMDMFNFLSVLQTRGSVEIENNI
jgi:transmembrane 9 superfamily protein 2/4